MGGVIASLNTMAATYVMSHHHKLNKSVARVGFKHPVEDVLFKKLSSDDDGEKLRIFVHWGVYESGKSRAVKNVALRLQEESEKLVMLLNGYDFTYYGTVHESVRWRIGWPEEQYYTLIDKPIVIIIDHAEILLRHHGVDEVLKALQELMVITSQNIRMLLVVTSWEVAQDLREKGCKMVGEPDCGRWNYDQLLGVWETLSLKKRTKFPEETHETILTQCAKAGAVGELTYIINFPKVDEKRLKKRAVILDNEWRNGILALNGGQPDDVGRFPDKSGIFGDSLWTNTE